MPGNWQELVNQMTPVQKLVHLAARADAVYEQELKTDLLRARRRAYEDELSLQAMLAGCGAEQGLVSEGALLSELDEQCREDAAGIVNTYNTDLAHIITNIGEEMPTANRFTYKARFKTWDHERAIWKKQQIGLYTDGSARAKAQQDFYGENGLHGEAKLAPEDAKCPVCIGWIARGMVPILEARRNPPPYHVNCPHRWDMYPEQVDDCAMLWMGDAE